MKITHKYRDIFSVLMLVSSLMLTTSGIIAILGNSKRELKSSDQNVEVAPTKKDEVNADSLINELRELKKHYVKEDGKYYSKRTFGIKHKNTLFAQLFQDGGLKLFVYFDDNLILGDSISLYASKLDGDSLSSGYFNISKNYIIKYVPTKQKPNMFGFPSGFQTSEERVLKADGYTVYWWAENQPMDIFSFIEKNVNRRIFVRVKSREYYHDFELPSSYKLSIFEILPLAYITSSINENNILLPIDLK